MTKILPGTGVRRGAWAIATLALAGAAAIAAPVAAVTPTPYDTNLVRNPGAEAGSVGTSVPYWDPFLEFQVVAYGTSGFPSKAESSTFSGGSKFFWAGPIDPAYGQCGDAVQDIFIRGRGAAIDSGHVKVILKARLAVKGSKPDRARVRLFFKDVDNHQLPGSPSPLVVSASATGGDFKLRSASKTMPKGTREVNVRVDATDADGDLTCYAYYDKITVKIHAV